MCLFFFAAGPLFSSTTEGARRKYFHNLRWLMCGGRSDWKVRAGRSRCVTFSKGQLAFPLPRLAQKALPLHLVLDRWTETGSLSVMERKLPLFHVCLEARSRSSLSDSYGRRRNPQVRREAWQCQNTRRAPTTLTQAPRRPVDQLLRQLCTGSCVLGHSRSLIQNCVNGPRHLVANNCGHKDL